MPGKLAKPTMTFTLGALFAFTTFATVLLALGRVLGFVATTLFFVAPFPLLGYLVFVRLTMRHFKVDYQSRWPAMNLGLAIGLLISALVSLMLFGAGLANLTLASA